MNENLTPGMVYLVGAGPGNPGLLTIRGAECLQRADVVLYDYLANASLLDHAPDAAELICLGRHRRADVWSQDKIQAEMVRRASAGQCVVRLKGGDPMVFGRIAEEVAALTDAQLPFEIVPGVTSASGTGAYAGVTLTDRQHASAVALVTGHQKQGHPSSVLDYQSLANFPGTLVIYMGVKTAPNWSQALIEAGKPADTPVVLVRRGTWPDQQTLTTTLADVADRLAQSPDFRPPVNVIIGNGVAKNPAMDWYARLPLRHQQVVITRPAAQAKSLARQLRELGAAPIVQPVIAIEPLRDWAPVDGVIDQLASYDVLVFASANGVAALLDRLLQRGLDARALAGCRLATVGRKTAESLARFGLRADIVPEQYRAESLADAIGASVGEGCRVLEVRADRGRDVLRQRLQAAGMQVEQIAAYHSVDVPVLSDQTVEQLDYQQRPWVTVTSSAIARGVCRLWGERLREMRLASISPITTATLVEAGYPPTAEATEHTMAGVIAAIQSSVADSSV